MYAMTHSPSLFPFLSIHQLFYLSQAIKLFCDILIFLNFPLPLFYALIENAHKTGGWKLIVIVKCAPQVTFGPASESHEILLKKGTEIQNSAGVP